MHNSLPNVDLWLEISKEPQKATIFDKNIIKCYIFKAYYHRFRAKLFTFCDWNNNMKYSNVPPLKEHIWLNHRRLFTALFIIDTYWNPFTFASFHFKRNRHRFKLTFKSILAVYHWPGKTFTLFQFSAIVGPRVVLKNSALLFFIAALSVAITADITLY